LIGECICRSGKDHCNQRPFGLLRARQRRATWTPQLRRRQT
jgi:hypothetical protein